MQWNDLFARFDAWLMRRRFRQLEKAMARLDVNASSAADAIDSFAMVYGRTVPPKI